MVSLITFLLFTFTCSASNACEKRDFRAALGPVRNQLDKGWCYAEAVAASLTVISGKRVATTSVMTRYYQTRHWSQTVRVAGLPSTNRFYGGIPATALNAALLKTICTEDEIGSSDFISEKEFTKFNESLRKYKATISPTEPTEVLKEVCANLQAILPGAQINVRNLLSLRRDVYDTIGAALDEKCKKLQGAFTDYEVVGESILQNTATAIKHMNDALDKNIPPVISIRWR